MVTKGIIQQIDLLSNTCKVRLPIFESAGNQKQVVLTATFSTAPGQSNCYTIDDVVIVGFEDNTIDQPVILGKLYLGNTIEQRGTFACKDLYVGERANIPITTTLDYMGSSQLSASEAGGGGFNTILDIITCLRSHTAILNQNLVTDLVELVTGASGQVFGVNANTKPTTFAVATTPVPNAIAYRTASGTLQAADPTEASDVVTLAYLQKILEAQED